MLSLAGSARGSSVVFSTHAHFIIEQCVRKFSRIMRRECFRGKALHAAQK
jgi:hypothetical protein